MTFQGNFFAVSKIALIGIGSNLSSPQANCRQALDHLEGHPDIETITCSAFYETEPLGVTEQNWFINAAARVTTKLEPDALLDLLLNVEKVMGRIRNEKWGPRIIDLDLLLYEDRIIKTPRLEIPHPEMTQRRFVLAPLNELAPDTVHPVTKKTIRQLLSELPDKGKVVKVHTTT